MRCHKAKNYICQEMDEHLPPDVTLALTTHLDSCADCREFRSDLFVGSRAIAATAPELPANFEWKLQLRLNQALQAAAGETVYPWGDQESDKWGWFRNFGAAAAVGMAAVLALAMFIGPTAGPLAPFPSDVGGGFSRVAASEAGGAGAADRLPLFGNKVSRGGLYSPGIQRPVAAGGGSVSSGGLLDRGWAGHNVEDLQTIQRLRFQNHRLNQQLFQQQLMMRSLQTQLDTTGTHGLDLEKK